MPVSCRAFDDGAKLRCQRRVGDAVDGAFDGFGAELRNELDLAGTDHRRHAARRVGIVRKAVQQLLRPGHLGRIAVGDLHGGRLRAFGDEVDGAPVAELGHGCGGDVPHQLAMVAGRERRIVEAVEELQPFPLEPLADGDPFGLPDPAFGLDVQLLAGRDVAGAADRAGDVALVVERHHAAAVEPVHRSVRPDRPGVRARTACRSAVARSTTARTPLTSSGCTSATHASIVPSNVPGSSPNSCSNASSHDVTPVAMSQRQVPS